MHISWRLTDGHSILLIVLMRMHFDQMFVLVRCRRWMHNPACPDPEGIPLENKL